MKLKIGCKFLVFLLFLILFTGFVLLCASDVFRNAPISKRGSDILNTKGSTNPSAPTLLSGEVQINDYYNLTYSNFYYRTSGTASSSYYHVFWLQPGNIANDFNLYLYSDSSYSVLRATSTRGAGALDWVMVRFSSSQYFYPKVLTYSGTGYGNIEWELGSSTLTIGGSVSALLSDSECIEVYRVALTASTSTFYSFFLDVPSGADYDLFLYYLNYGSATNSSGALRSSTMIGVGVDETIDAYRCSLTDNYILIVARKTGSGTFTLYSASRGIIALTDETSYSEFYGSTTRSYHYQTSTTASSSYYHAFWLQPLDVDDDFNLYLYSDSSYSILSASSTRDAGALDWVVIRPSSTQYYYPRGYENMGTGSATIEWESGSSTLYIGSPVSATLSSTECIEIYSIPLYTFLRYNFSLSVPDTADYDLYLYYLPSGATTNESGSIRSSCIAGNGVDELIANFTPQFSDYYSIFVVRKAGSGSFTLLPSNTATLLADDNSIYNLYNSTDSYHYQTSTMASSSIYHTFWLQPVDVDDDFNLYLYSDSGYSVLRASSTSGAGALDLVVIRPGSLQYYYPRVSRYSGVGYGYIEWDSSFLLSIGTPISALLDISDCIELYMVYLTSGVNYNFTLDVPDGADYNLYLYYLASGAATNSSGALRSSATIGSGIDETIGAFRATTTDYYIIAVVRQDGNGMFTLYSYSRNRVSLTDESAVYDTYDASFSYYYYQTSSTATSPFYHVFWLQPTEIDDDLNLYLYSDSGYSSLQAASTSSADALDWVLVRPSSSQYYYPKIHRNSGIGSAYIEWDASYSSLSKGYPTSSTLSSSECIETYRIDINALNIYNFILDVPETADFDLYLYYLNSGTAINQSGFIKSSTTLGSTDEYLMQYRPQNAGEHLLLVVRRSGTGTYTLYYSSNTTNLYDEYAFYDYYNASRSFYYYQTSTTVSTSYYHVMWLQPTEMDDDFNLYLYSDSSYSTLRAASLKGLGGLDWVAFRPSSSQYYYPKAHRYSGIGFMYIEWESSSSTLSIGTPLSNSLNASECLEVYMVYLSAGMTYNFTLDVPSGADYDLYLCYLTSGGATNSSGALRSSTMIGVGLDETISDFRAPSTNYYILIVARQTGAGTFTLYSYSRGIISLTDETFYSEFYGSFTNYTYQTGSTASSSYYHAFWLLPIDIDDDFNLYLYSDSGYSTLRASSTNGAGALDWVMVRPSSTQYYYPLGHRYTGSGNVYIEWEIVFTGLSIGTPVSTSLSPFESIEAYRIQLCNFLRYNFSLSVPDTADYDLYLYYLPLGTATNASGYINSSRISGNGFDETIQNFSPEFTDYYSIFVVRKGGSGSFTLFSSSTAIRLADDNSIYNLYNSTNSYYYQTSSTASTSYYHVFWLQPTEIDDDFNLYLYSDIPYSLLQASSTSSAGALEWIIVRPSSSQYYYPRVSRYSGMGYGHIEWESSSSVVSFGIPITASLNTSECIEVYMVYLSAGASYNFTLDVPDGADYDLYLYYLSYGATTNQSGAFISSTTIGMGINEKTGEFRPTTTDYYMVAVVRQQGNGSFTLYSYSQSTIYLTDESAALNSYSASFSYYYYQTSTMASSSYYHVFWLQPIDINNDFNLYLYLNSGYSILQATSTSSIGALDWVIVRPSSSQYYYPKTHRNLGIGSAYIEWDAASSSLSNGYPSSGVLSTSECIETYRISLSTSYTYNFNLDVSDGADFDLYLYYLNSGTAVNQSGFVRSSRNLGNLDESILQYRPQIPSDHLVLVVRRSGTGTYTLYCSSNTTYLYDEYAFYDYYNASLSSYYYQTNGAPSTSYCHVVWLQPTVVYYDFNLYLYSNSGYSTLSASSTRSAGALDWVVFRPSSTQAYYPKVQRNSGIGSAFIEWEAGSSTLSIGIPLSDSLNYSECIEIYRVYLSAGTPYNFTLDVPSGANYDLYLYYLSSGNAISWNNYVRSSTNSGSGIDEKIDDYSAPYTDYYLILVVRNYGTGTFSLSCVSNARILLSDDSERSQSYNFSYTDVYYRTTFIASSTYYHVVWLQPYNAYDDFDLYLFSDNSYSNFKASSTRGDGCLDWVIFCPSSSQYYYPMVDTKADTGDAYIEWEDGSSTISSGSYASGSLYYYDCIELYQATLSTSKEYDFSLSVPSGCDFDLYLYFLNPGSAITGSSVYLRASVHSSAGYDESIDDFQPPKSGNYAIIVVWKSGSGSYNLDLKPSNAPSDPLNLVITVLLIIVIIAIIGVSAVAIYKYKEIWASPPTSSQSAPSTPAMRSESSNKLKAYKQSERSEPHYPQISKQQVRSFDYYCLYCGRLVRAGKKCQSCNNGSNNHLVS